MNNNNNGNQRRDPGRVAEQQRRNSRERGQQRSLSSQGTSPTQSFNAAVDSRGRKGWVQQNHLLNFSFAERPKPEVVRPPRRRTTFQPYDKEKYTLANFRFNLHPKAPTQSYALDADHSVVWEDVAQVVVDEASLCPICLTEPVAGKITKCGHVFCWACILHYLALGDRPWRRCPICYESVYARDLRNVVVEAREPIEDGTVLTFTLMQRAKGSTVATPRGLWSAAYNESVPPEAAAELACFSHVTVLSPERVRAILEQERTELETALAVATADGETETADYVGRAQKMLDLYEQVWVHGGSAEELSSSFVRILAGVTEPEPGATQAAASEEQERQWPSLSQSPPTRFMPAHMYSQPRTIEPSLALQKLAKPGRSRWNDSDDEAVPAPVEDEGYGGDHWDALSEEDFATEQREQGHQQQPQQSGRGVVGDTIAHDESGDHGHHEHVAHDAGDEEIVGSPASVESYNAQPLRNGGPSRNGHAVPHGQAVFSPPCELRPGQDADAGSFYYFYQSVDGRRAYLDPFSFRLLQAEFPNLNDFPRTISAEVVGVQSMAQSEALRKKYKYLDHLPLRAELQLCEVDLSSALSDQTYAQHADEIEQRQKARQRYKRKQLMIQREAERVEREQINARKAAAAQNVFAAAGDVDPVWPGTSPSGSHSAPLTVWGGGGGYSASTPGSSSDTGVEGGPSGADRGEGSGSPEQQTTFSYSRALQGLNAPPPQSAPANKSGKKKLLLSNTSARRY